MKNSNLKQEQIIIDGKQVTKELLLDIACTLTSLATNLRGTRQTLDLLEYSRSNDDMFPYHYYIQSDGFECLGDNLEQIEKKIQDISNSICPDEISGGNQDD